MASCQEPLLKSDDEDDLVFDRTGLLSNKVTVKPDVCQRGHFTGKRMQYARTVNLCLAFFALGLCFAIPTATLNDLQTTVGADLADIEFIYTARYGGYVFGSIIGGILFDRYNRQFLLFLSLLATAVGIITVPFCTKVGALMACTAITGITMGFLDTGGNVWCLDLWGKKSAPFMQTLHFCFGLGAFVAPLVAEPFLSPHFGNSTGLLDSSTVNVTLKNIPHVWFPHQRVKAYPEHNIKKENVLQHTNSSALEDAVYETFPLRKLPRHFYKTSQNFEIQNAHIQGINRQHVKRYADLHVLEGSKYVRNINMLETENHTLFSNISDYYASNNINVSHNIIGYLGNSSSQEDATVTQLIATTSVPTIDSISSTKLKPKKPHYADGNQLKHDDKWVRTSLKQKTQNDLNKSIKQEINSTTIAMTSTKIFTKMSDTSLNKGFSNSGILFISNVTDDVGIKNYSTNKLQLDSNNNQHEDHRNATDDSEFHISDSNITGKSSVNFSLNNTEFIFPIAKSVLLYVTPTQDYDAYKIQNVKEDANNRTPETLHITQKVKSLVEKELNPLMLQHTLENTSVSENLQSDGYSETAESPSIKITSYLNQTKGNDSQVPFFWINANFINSSTETGNKTEFKQTSLRSAEISELTSTSPQPIELYNTETVEAVDIQISNERSSQLNLSNNISQASSWDIKEIIITTESSSEIVKPKEKFSHVDFLSSLFATMCQHRLGKFEIAYVILGIYIFIVAFVFLICLCLNPREPRSRQEEQLDKSRNITTSFKISVVILVSLFLCLYVGIEVAVGQLLQTFTVKQYLQLPESTGYFMTYSFWGSFALARGISIALSIKFSGLCLLFIDLVICLTTSLLLVIGANKVEALLWVGIVVLAFGMAPIFPAVIAWIEHYLPITNRIASAFILGTALGEMTIPLIIQRFINQEPMVLMYVNVIVNVLCLVTFIALWFLASHQGEKYKIKIDRTMYQLANFDDVEDGYELCFANSRWQNDYNSHILLERKLVGKTT